MINRSKLSLISLVGGFLTIPSFGLAQELRPLSTDRPDATESPYSVDAGHFQMEIEIGNWSKDSDERSFSLAEVNVKYGLDASNDLQLVMPMYQHTEGGADGFGDLQIRLKHNLWGNDGGTSALALLPFIQVPTANDGVGSGKIEGGLIVPLSIEGPAGWGWGGQVGVEVLTDQQGAGYHAAFMTSATASHALTECTGFFVEWVGTADAESSDFNEAYANLGFTWTPEPYLQLDGGLRFGLTKASPDITPFLGFSRKF